jgi:hypothetical protein
MIFRWPVRVDGVRRFGKLDPKGIRGRQRQVPQTDAGALTKSKGFARFPMRAETGARRFMLG